MNWFKKIINLLSLIAEINLLILANQLGAAGKIDEGKPILYRLTRRHKEIMGKELK